MWRRTRGRLLEAAEKEYFVLLNRPADGGTVLVASQGVLRGREEIAGIKVAVANKFERISVKRVRAGLSNDVDYRTGMNTVTGGHAVRLHAELLQGVREGEG